MFVCKRYETLHLLLDVGHKDEHSVEIRRRECDVLIAVIQVRNPNPKSNPNRYRFIENYIEDPKIYYVLSFEYKCFWENDTV